MLYKECCVETVHQTVKDGREETLLHEIAMLINGKIQKVEKHKA